MIEDLKPYPEYQDSGLRVLGDVPAHWKVRTLRRILRPFDGIKIGPFGSQLKLDEMSTSGYKVYGQANVIAADFTRGSKFIDDSKFQELSSCAVQSGDLVLTMMGTTGRCAYVPVSACAGIMDSHLLRLRLTDDVEPAFCALVLDKSSYVKEQISLVGKGSIMQGLNSQIVKEIVIAFPPVREQALIVKYLDHVDRRIRRYISCKRKLIKLLEGQKQAITQRTITSGLDPNVRLKPSGLKWVGNVPEHWEVKRAKWFYHEVDERSVSGDEELLSVSHLTGVTPRAEKNITMFMAESYAGHKLCRQGDLVINTMWAWMGALGVSPAYAVYRPFETDLFAPEFTEMLLRSNAYKGEFVCRSTGIRSSRLRLYPEEFFRIPLMRPSIDEQHAIVASIREHTAELDGVKDAAQREVALLEEYRDRLLADLVTGRLDVRNAAAGLSDEMSQDRGLFDDEEALTEIDLEADDSTLQDDLEEIET